MVKIITISGLDGSGKSTQVRSLKNYLESQGKQVFYFHAIQFGMANKIIDLQKYCLICRILGKCKVRKNDSEKSVTKANKLQIWLRKIFLKIDLRRFKKLIVKLEKRGYDYLVSDRYFYDSVVNIDYLYNNLPLEKGDFRRTEGFLESNQELKSPLVPLLQRGRIIKPNLAVYLQTSPEIIIERERVPDQGIEYLQRKKDIYDKYAKILNLTIINGNHPKEEIFEEIKNYYE